MDNFFSLIPNKSQYAFAVNNLRELNALTARFGLSLSDDDIRSLVLEQKDAVSACGRFEFENVILNKLASAFCDSPFIINETWAATLSELIDCFYYYKTESEDTISDDELIEYMRLVFDEPAQGSLDYMASVNLDELCRKARNGGTK